MVVDSVKDKVPINNDAKMLLAGVYVVGFIPNKFWASADQLNNLKEMCLLSRSSGQYYPKT